MYRTMYIYFGMYIILHLAFVGVGWYKNQATQTIAELQQRAWALADDEFNCITVFILNEEYF